MILFDYCKPLYTHIYGYICVYIYIHIRTAQIQIYIITFPLKASFKSTYMLHVRHPIVTQSSDQYSCIRSNNSLNIKRFKDSGDTLMVIDSLKTVKCNRRLPLFVRFKGHIFAFCSKCFHHWNFPRLIKNI